MATSSAFEKDVEFSKVQLDGPSIIHSALENFKGDFHFQDLKSMLFFQWERGQRKMVFRISITKEWTKDNFFTFLESWNSDKKNLPDSYILTTFLKATF